MFFMDCPKSRKILILFLHSGQSVVVSIPVQPKFPNLLTFSSDLLHNKIHHMLETLLKIENEVSQTTKPGNTFLVTMDISSLYPNIDHAESISACEEMLSNRKSPSVPTSVISNLLKLILQCNTLKFGKRFFRQVKGTAMGTPMASNYANAFRSQSPNSYEFVEFYGVN